MRSRFEQRKPARHGLMTRLSRDTRGGVYIMFALAFFPLLAMIGSGIDMSRAYMAHNRLQMACDAAALAGRRAMTNGTVDTTVTTEARKFFQFNYKTGTDGVAGTAAFATTGFTPSVIGAANSTVVVSAATVVPTSIMRLFGFVNIPIQVTCNARLDFVNTDIVLVLDSTGSMADKAQSSDTDTKIVALRKAVLSFYDTLLPIKTQLEANGLRMRFAIVPYSSSVNIGRVLRGASTSYVASDNWTYQSRRYAYQHTEYNVSRSYCDSKNGSYYYSYRSNTYYCVYVDQNSSNGTGVWEYLPQTFDISTYVTGASTPDPTRTPGTNSNVTWAGCIEERQTTNALTSTSTSIPTEALDLNIDMVPSNDKTTKWKPYWPDVEYLPSSISYSYGGEAQKPQWACPAEARRLQAWSRADLSNYLDTLIATGGTYHDNGMRWGIRMLSGLGVFSTDNPSTFGGMPVSKYIIFMTDGLMDTGYNRLYTTYGVEQFDARVTPGGNASSEDDQQARHLNRFNLLCTVAKNRGISVWVVAFAQSLDTNLTSCASNTNQASTSANSAALNARFVEIGKNIGALRLTQ